MDHLARMLALLLLLVFGAAAAGAEPSVNDPANLVTFAAENQPRSSGEEALGAQAKGQLPRGARSQAEGGTDSLQLEMMKTTRLFAGLTAGMYLATLLISTYFFKVLHCRPRDLITVLGLVSVVFATVLVTLAADTSDQLTASIGVLAAIAGYLFGSSHREAGTGSG